MPPAHGRRPAIRGFARGAWGRANRYRYGRYSWRIERETPEWFRFPRMKLQRKIVHVEMNAFYSSFEQRDDPLLRIKPLLVAHRACRSVVCVSSYEVRKFGIRSAMPALQQNESILRLSSFRPTPTAVREVFLCDIVNIEPLSLDEAYLGGTENKTGLAKATEVAGAIRKQIKK